MKRRLQTPSSQLITGFDTPMRITGVKRGPGPIHGHASVRGRVSDRGSQLTGRPRHHRPHVDREDRQSNSRRRLDFDDMIVE